MSPVVSPQLVSEVDKIVTTKGGFEL